MTELLKSLTISYTLPTFIVVMIYFRTRNSYINIALSHENQIATYLHLILIVYLTFKFYTLMSIFVIMCLYVYQLIQ